jgi:hypothetical protein
VECHCEGKGNNPSSEIMMFLSNHSQVNSNFFKEVPMIANRFKYMYALMIPCVGGMIYLAKFAPRGWEITNFAAILPLGMQVGSHLLLPLVLNPSLVIFSY